MSISVLEAVRTFKKQAMFVVAVGVGLVAGTIVHAAFFSTNEPAQPIEFSHKIHAGDMGIPCQSCHIYVAKSPSSSVPSVNKCWNCHKSMPGVFNKPEIVTLRQYWENKEPIPWVKVHDVADFVYFPHKRHVQAGVECASCHGEVETMERVRQVTPLSMKWCIDCHDERQVQHGRDCWTCHK